MRLFKHIFILTIFLPLTILANTNKPLGKYTKKKEIHKEYSATANPKLRLGNEYGDVTISSWDGDKIVVDVQVITNGDNENEVSKALEKIYVIFDMNTKKNLLEVGTRGTSEVKTHKEVHYQVKIPKTCPLWVYNQFGNIVIDETEANTELLVSYGNIMAGKLNGSKTKLYFGYSQSSSVDYVNDAYVWGSFSDWEIKKAGTLSLENLHSSNSTIREVNKIHYKKCSYGTLRVNKVINSINGDGDYLTIRIDNLQGKISNIKSEYGGIEINKWDVERLDFNVKQAKLSLGYEADESFDLNLEVNSCTSFRDMTTNGIPKSFVQYKKTKDKDHHYRYYNLKKGTDKTINVSMTKGILRFNKITDVIAEK